jgi:hypothetical protein
MSNISQNRRQTGTLFTCLTIFLIALSALASRTSALAGSFSTSYSGGASQGYGPYADWGTPGAYGIGSDNEGGAESDTSKITANFTWVPNPAYPTNDPEPGSVIIRQYSSSYWVDSDGYAELGSGSCDNGLGSGITTTSAGNDGGIAGQTSTGYEYTLNTGNTISCTPSGIYGGVFGGCGVDYSATPYPITIGVNGAVQDTSGNWDILVGQGCTSSLQGVPGNCTVSNYVWTVSGTTLQDWSPSTPAGFLGFGANPDASYEVDGPGPLTNATASWFWNDPGPGPDKETITCTATVTPPSGEGSPINVSAKINVWVYLPICTSGCVGGEMVVYQTAGSGDWRFGAFPSASGETGGMDFRAQLFPPYQSPVSSWNTNFGSLFLVQLITPNVEYEDSSQVWWKDDNFSHEGLDTTSPYPWVSYQNDAWGEIEYMTRDSPYIDLTYFGAIAASFDDSFEDYLMYTPPPCGSNYVQTVPLGYFSWSTYSSASCDVTVPSTGWSTTVVGSVDQLGSAFSSKSIFPSWAQLNGTGIDTFVQQ